MKQGIQRHCVTRIQAAAQPFYLQANSPHCDSQNLVARSYKVEDIASRLEAMATRNKKLLGRRALLLNFIYMMFDACAEVISSRDAPIFVGNAVPLDKVPIGTMAGRPKIQYFKLLTKGSR